MSKKLIAIVLIILGAAGLLFLYFVKPGWDTIYPKCPTRVFTGLNCPGCGTLRALNSLLHLNFKEALKFNILAVVLSPFLIYGFVVYLVDALFSKKLPEIFSNKIFLRVLIGFIIAFTILRNTPVYPFNMFKG